MASLILLIPDVSVDGCRLLERVKLKGIHLVVRQYSFFFKSLSRIHCSVKSEIDLEGAIN